MKCTAHKMEIYPATFNKYKADGYYKARARRSFPSGMTGEFEFWGSETNRGKFIEVSFILYNKRNTAWKEENIITGRDGLEPLIWAKNTLLGLNNPIYMFYRWKDFTIEINASDSKRLRAYHKTLSRYGYDKLLSNDKTLIKKVYYDYYNEHENYCYSKYCQ